jgi:hypothetical protein
MKRYTGLRLQSAQTDTERFATEFVLKLFKKRLFSSPAAFDITLDKHSHTLGRMTPELSARIYLSLVRTALPHHLTGLGTKNGFPEKVPFGALATPSTTGSRQGGA